MHRLNFVTVNAESCKKAIESARVSININDCIVDYFMINGVFNLDNPSDFKRINKSRHFTFNDVLGQNPTLFKQRVLDILNSHLKPLNEYLDDLREIINNYESNVKPQWQLGYEIQHIGKAIEGNYTINDLVSQSKYEFEWEECGLTHIDEEPTHLVLVDFHM